MANNRQIHESAEDYLERILVLTQRNGMVRSIDIVNEMNFSKPSISVAMKKLREAGQIEMDDNGYIKLTDEGRVVAERTYARHTLLTKCLIALGVDEERADEQACHIEHVIDDETYNKINAYYEKHWKK
ncbi:MAG: metal-dependent transcriptional regulator [Lachnospiraceae bacterium]|nr:metal-dependent transcriptional regulator [Lachnospiraceae bacterium]